MSPWANYAAAVSLTSDHPPYGKGLFPLCGMYGHKGYVFLATLVRNRYGFWPVWSPIGYARYLYSSLRMGVFFRRGDLFIIIIGP